MAQWAYVRNVIKKMAEKIKELKMVPCHVCFPIIPHTKKATMMNRPVPRMVFLIFLLSA